VRRSHPLALLAAAAIAVGLAACGTGDDAADPSSTAAPVDPSAGLLRLSDLPPGWTEEPIDSDPEGARLCGLDLASRTVERADAGFRDPAGAEVVESSVVVLSDDGAAADALAEIEATLAGCREWATVAQDGRGLTFEVTPEAVAPLGDGSTGVRLATTTRGFELDGLAIVTRVGPALQLLLDLGIEPDLDEAGRLAEIGAERLEETTGG
jgi:hypothetical protein